MDEGYKVIFWLPIIWDLSLLLYSYFTRSAAECRDIRLCWKEALVKTPTHRGVASTYHLSIFLVLTTNRFSLKRKNILGRPSKTTERNPPPQSGKNLLSNFWRPSLVGHDNANMIMFPPPHGPPCFIILRYNPTPCLNVSSCLDEYNMTLYLIMLRYNLTPCLIMLRYNLTRLEARTPFFHRLAFRALRLVWGTQISTLCSLGYNRLERNIALG